VAPPTVATWAKVQGEPEQRSIRYWATVPESSVAGCQERSIRVELKALAVRVPGALGGVVSGGAGVVAVAVFE
jgi:hypothetical protein